MSYLIDTDWLIDYLSGRPQAVALLESLIPAPFFISIITYAEVYEGVYYNQNPQQQEQAFGQFLQAASVVGISEEVAQVWATIRGSLRRTGLLIPPADLFIAATAVFHDLTLVTRNLKHFDRVPDLKLLQQ